MNDYVVIYRARVRLLGWRGDSLISFEGTSYDEVRRLFGVSGDLVDIMDGPKASIMLGLAGPYGLTIYKMLCAKYGLTDDTR